MTGEPPRSATPSFAWSALAAHWPMEATFACCPRAGHHTNQRFLCRCRAAYRLAAAKVHSRAVENRFAIRPDPSGFSVYDLQTGETLVIAMARQSGLSREDAEHTASVFNQPPPPLRAAAH